MLEIAHRLEQQIAQMPVPHKWTAELMKLPQLEADNAEHRLAMWLEKEEQGTSGFSQVSSAYRLLVEEHGRQQLVIDGQLRALFAFVERSWAGGNEMLILMTELAAEPSCSGYLFTYGSEPYDRYSSLLRLSDRKQELDQEIAEYMKQ